MRRALITALAVLALAGCGKGQYDALGHDRFCLQVARDSGGAAAVYWNCIGSAAMQKRFTKG